VAREYLQHDTWKLNATPALLSNKHIDNVQQFPPQPTRYCVLVDCGCEIDLLALVDALLHIATHILAQLSAMQKHVHVRAHIVQQLAGGLTNGGPAHLKSCLNKLASNGPPKSSRLLP
jgi:hypothetical protein